MERNLLEREIAALNNATNSLDNLQLATSTDSKVKLYQTGKFYGFLTEKSFLRNQDLKTKQTFGKRVLYYPNKQMVEILGENTDWFLVEGGATDEKNGIEQNLQGWIKKSWVKPITSKWLDVFRDATPNKVEYLIDGKETFKNIAETIRTAKKKGDFIYILGWMLHIKFPLIDNKPDSTLKALLTDAANKGVEVRVLIWDNFGDYPQIRPHINELNQAHTNIKAFVDTATYSTPATRVNIAIVISKLRQLYTMIQVVASATGGIAALVILAQLYTKINKYLNIGSVGSQHDKVVIVKGDSGLTAFCGGIDFNPNRFKDYHDLQCKVEGGLGAYQILQKFILRWKNHPQASSLGLLGDKETPDIDLGGPFRLAKVVGTYNKPDGSGEKDRSLSRAYFDIIKRSKEFIYIEDQYLVNLDVAQALNLKIRDPEFKKLIIVIQDPLETEDMFFPNRKRIEFRKFLIANTTPAERGKFYIWMIDSQTAKTKGYHPGLHSKLLIADDEIAIIGTANINQRSFTLDSETSVVIFDSDDTQPKFAKQLRDAIWNEYFSGNTSKFLSVYRDVNNDLDQRIMSAVTIPSHVLGVNAAISSILESSVPLLWNHIIDPKV